MTPEISIAVIAGLGLFLVSTLLWAVHRELLFSSSSKKIASGMSELPGALHQVERSLENVMSYMTRHSDDAKGQSAEIRDSLAETKRLVLDVERRLSDIIRDARIAPSVFNTQSSGHGAQSNQGGTVSDTIQEK